MKITKQQLSAMIADIITAHNLTGFAEYFGKQRMEERIAEIKVRMDDSPYFKFEACGVWATGCDLTINFRTKRATVN